MQQTPAFIYFNSQPTSLKEDNSKTYKYHPKLHSPHNENLRSPAPTPQNNRHTQAEIHILQKATKKTPWPNQATARIFITAGLVRSTTPDEGTKNLVGKQHPSAPTTSSPCKLSVLSTTARRFVTYPKTESNDPSICRASLAAPVSQASAAVRQSAQVKVHDNIISNESFTTSMQIEQTTPNSNQESSKTAHI